VETFGQPRLFNLLHSCLPLLWQQKMPPVIPPLDLDQRYSRFRIEFLLKMSRSLGQNQFAGRTHAGLQEVPAVGRPVGTSHHHMRMHLRLSVPEGDVADERKQFHLLVKNAGWIVLFRLPVEPAQFRVRERAPMALKLLPAKPCSLANCSRKLAISLPVSKIRTRVFGSSSMSELVFGRPPKAAAPAMQVHVQLR
jgi:hypothetical protein